MSKLGFALSILIGLNGAMWQQAVAAQQPDYCNPKLEAPISVRARDAKHPDWHVRVPVNTRSVRCDRAATLHGSISLINQNSGSGEAGGESAY